MEETEEREKKESKKKKEKKKKSRVRLSRPGCEPPPIHGCDPTTVRRGSFCLLRFRPGPVRSSLTNLVTQDSSRVTILTPDLARTPDRHRTTAPRNPDLKPFNDPNLQAAGLQACATTPGWWRKGEIIVLLCWWASLSRRTSLSLWAEVKNLSWTGRVDIRSVDNSSAKQSTRVQCLTLLRFNQILQRSSSNDDSL